MPEIQQSWKNVKFHAGRAWKPHPKWQPKDNNYSRPLKGVRLRSAVFAVAVATAWVSHLLVGYFSPPPAAPIVPCFFGCGLAWASRAWRGLRPNQKKSPRLK